MNRTTRFALPFALLLTACGEITGGGEDGGTSSDMAPATVEPKFSSLYASYLSGCQGCHAPNAPGRTSMIEMALDFSTKATAFTTLTTGNATGLVGNQSACNGVPFVVKSKPAESLLVAVIDQPTRSAFTHPTATACDATAITDETVKVGTEPSDSFVAALKQWITDGAPNN